MPTAIVYFAATLLFVGVLPLPYGYYSVLRIISAGVFAFAALVAFQRKRQVLAWSFAIPALLFNPVSVIHFPKEIWMWVDAASGLLLLVGRKAIRTHNPKHIEHVS